MPPACLYIHQLYVLAGIVIFFVHNFNSCLENFTNAWELNFVFVFPKGNLSVAMNRSSYFTYMYTTNILKYMYWSLHACRNACIHFNHCNESSYKRDLFSQQQNLLELSYMYHKLN